MFHKSILSIALASTLMLGAASAQAIVLDSTTVRAFGSANNANDLFLTADPRANMTMLATSTNSLIFLGDNVGSVIDQVWKDNTTGKLSFFTRVTMTTAGYEVNDIVRSGFTGFTTDVTWFKNIPGEGISGSMRLKSAGHTDSIGVATDVYKADYINLRSDISVEEGKPNSGWYVINTDATAFTTITGTTASDYGIFLRSTGEDVGAPASLFLAAFAPTTVAAVPEPESYAMLLAGLGIMGFVARRRTQC